MIEEDDDDDFEGAWADLRPIKPLPPVLHDANLRQTISSLSDLSEAALADAFARIEALEHKVVEVWVSSNLLRVLERGRSLKEEPSGKKSIFGARVVEVDFQRNTVKGQPCVWLQHRPNPGSFH